jgi:threonine/homoserine/homoserine lactone efflux protein
VNTGLLLSFLAAAVVVQILPGPGMLFIVANGISGGPRAGVAAACGAATGMVVHTCAAALGLAALFQRAPAAYDGLRIVGAVYLIWMAIGHLRGDGAELGERAGRNTRPARRVYVRACLNNLANPKVILFYLAFLPQFVDPHSGSVPVQLLALGSVFLLLGLAIDLCIGLLAGRIGEWLRGRASAQRLLDKLAGAILAALGVRLLVWDGRT